jgi:hypothetical protein
VSVTNLTTTYATLSLSLTRTEWGEVIVKEEALIALVEHIVNHLLIEFGTQRTGRE